LVRTFVGGQVARSGRPAVRANVDDAPLGCR
jgi:hypothetical protein